MTNILVIQGPTAVGKSGVAATLAKHFNCPVISADSRQFYKEMMVGTAVPSTEEMMGVKHYFIQDRSVQQPLSAGEFENEALALIDKLSQGKSSGEIVAVVAGGSGLYVDALLNGLDPIARDSSIREMLNNRLEIEGLDSLLRELKRLDPDYFGEVETGNPQRVIRALEASLVSGVPYSKLRVGRAKSRPFGTIRVIIDLPRAELYSRINNRVDEMVEGGLVEEARSVHKYSSLNPLKTVGYSELFEFFNGKTNLLTAIELIKQHTRNYAKRQLTWLRRDSSTPRFSPYQIDSIIQYITTYLTGSN